MKMKHLVLTISILFITVFIVLGVDAKNWKTQSDDTPFGNLRISAEYGCVSDACNFLLEYDGKLPDHAKIFWDFGNGNSSISTSLNQTHTYTSSGIKTMTCTVSWFGGEASESAYLTVNLNNCNEDEISRNCCNGSFAPIPEKKYIISAWVREEGQNLTTFKSPYLTLSFYKNDYKQKVFLGPYRAKGSIIEGWQRIEEIFEVPPGAETISVRMNNRSDNENIFFDDIRIYPFEGNMKSYVYDPVTKRLMADLDQNNYATIYEYSDEGEMIRVKKETERGIMTISESRSGTIKKDNKK